MRRQCRICKYSKLLNGTTDNNKRHRYCDFAEMAGYTCLTLGPGGQVIDRRGDDRRKCNLYERRKKNESTKRADF